MTVVPLSLEPTVPLTGRFLCVNTAFSPSRSADCRSPVTASRVLLLPVRPIQLENHRSSVDAAQLRYLGFSSHISWAVLAYAVSHIVSAMMARLLAGSSSSSTVNGISNHFDIVVRLCARLPRRQFESRNRAYAIALCASGLLIAQCLVRRFGRLSDGNKPEQP